MAKVTIIPSSVLGGQGGQGSRPMFVPNPTPGIAAEGGDLKHGAEAPANGGDHTLSTEFGSFTDKVNGPVLGSAIHGE